MQEMLAEQKIYDIQSLIAHCNTQPKRNDLANKLEIKVEYVNSWVKQADLWKVNDMTADIAFMLVQAGIRDVHDLGRADSAKLYPFLESLAASQPEFELCSQRELDRLIESAASIDRVSFDANEFQARINSFIGGDQYVSITPETIQSIIKESRLKNVSTDYGFEDMEPTFLLKTGSSDVEALDNQKLTAAWKDLFELDCTLPLPRLISGNVKKRSIVSNSQPKPFEGVTVEIDGVVSPAEDKTEAVKNPSCITDATGHFIITLPERYCFKETVKVIISNLRGKQEFILNSSVVMNSMEEKDFVDALQSILANRICYRTAYLDKQRYDSLSEEQDSLNKELDSLSSEEKVERTTVVVYDVVQPNQNNVAWSNNVQMNQVAIAKNEGQTNRDKLTSRKETVDGLLASMDPDSIELNLENKTKDYKTAIDTFKSTYTDTISDLNVTLAVDSLSKEIADEKDEVFDMAFQKIFSTVLEKATLEAKIKGPDTDGDFFLVIQEIFNGEDPEAHKSLPSVKLMGDDESPVMLSTDTAPSKMYTYSMLQRLIEPTFARNGQALDRETLKTPIDVAQFKEQFINDPVGFPQMSSLGLGYQLNMHQAWVPDGFALGDLLYSLILAPGEEQRLIVRENTQTFTIMDTAEGMDSVSEEYANSQKDDTSAVYDYAVEQMMDASSSFKTKSSSWSIGGSLSGSYSGISLGLTGGYSKSSSSGSSKANQRNTQDEASSASQQFQQNIKTSSNRLAQAKRLSISTASSDVSESVATKIIANHNHSHTMTIQYWEVMRRYRLETAIDGIDLVLFVPLKPIKFLGDETDLIFPESAVNMFNKARFARRYGVLLKHANALEYALPWKYRAGFNLIKKYSACPKWEMESSDEDVKTLVVEFKGNFFEFDDLSATVILKNGKGSYGGQVTYTRKPIQEKLETTTQVKNFIRAERNKIGTTQVKCTFNLSAGVVADDIQSIKISHSCEGLTYDLFANVDHLTINQHEAYYNYLHKQWDFAKDNNKSSGDVSAMAHYMEILPEAFKNPHLTLSANEINRLGYPLISSDGLSVKLNGLPLMTVLSSTTLAGNTYISISTDIKTLRRSEFQKMEETFHHIVTDTLKYSQVVWGSLSSDERALLLDQYTIQMDYSKLRAKSKDSEDNGSKETPIPLLNCVNIRKVLGFYGNCILLPFTFPQELADILGRTAAEVQDQLYRYHTNSFRAPTTVISIPTKGMIGEAVLGQTNVSEVIDLTRFWNWQDSPIDKMEIDSSYLTGNDYLEGKSTKDITSMGLQSATATAPVTTADLISALVGKQTPQFDNLTGQEQLSALLSKTTESAASGRDKIIDQTSSMVNKSLEMAQKQKEAEINANKEIEIEKIKKGIAPTPQSGGEITEQNKPVDAEKEEEDDNNVDSPIKNEDFSAVFEKLREYLALYPSAKPEDFLKEVYNISYEDSTSIEKAADSLLKADGGSLSSIVSNISNLGK